MTARELTIRDLESAIERESKQAFAMQKPCYGKQTNALAFCVACADLDACGIEFTATKEKLEIGLNEVTAIAEVNEEHERLTKIDDPIKAVMTEKIGAVPETIFFTKNEVEKGSKVAPRKRHKLDFVKVIKLITEKKPIDAVEVGLIIHAVLEEAPYENTVAFYTRKILAQLAKGGVVEWTPKAKDIKWLI